MDTNRQDAGAPDELHDARRGGPPGRPGGIRRAGAPHLRRHVHARRPTHRERGGRTGRGAGGLPPSLEGHPPLPWRRRVHDVAVPHHGERVLHARRPPPPASHDAPRRRARADRHAVSTPGPTTLAESNAGLGELAVALDQLPPTLRTIVILKDVYGLSHEDIADETGISVAAAKVRLHRGRKRLRDLLDEPKDAAREVGSCGVTRSHSCCPKRSTATTPVALPVQRHVESCLRCQAELARYRRMLRGLQLLRTQYLEPAPGVLSQTLAAHRRGVRATGDPLGAHRASASPTSGRSAAPSPRPGRPRPRCSSHRATPAGRARHQLTPRGPSHSPRRRGRRASTRRPRCGSLLT